MKHLLTAIVVVAASAALGFGQSRRTEATVSGGIATLYALDPLARTFCFADGREGGVFQNNGTFNRCSDIDFNTYNEGSFTVGIEGGRIGAIVDLGTATELEKRYGYDKSETFGKGQGFASLRVENNRVLILKDKQPHSEQDLTESESLFAASMKGPSAPIKLGHIYVLRLVDRYDKNFERVVKLLVVSYTPNESVTIRWQVM